MTVTPNLKTQANAQSGVSAIEMALLLPLLMLMLDAVLEFGLILHNKSVLTSAANMAARAGIVQTSPKLSNAQISTIATQYCTNRLMAWGTPEVPNITVVQAADPSYPNPLQVTVRYTVKGLFVGGLLAAFQTNPELSATTVMYNE
jgi:Flp pilus assembly protein TadG